MKFIYFLFFISLFGLLASSGGINSNTAGAPTGTGGNESLCSSCHFGSTGTGGTVFLSGAPTSYTPGTSYNMSITVTKPENDPNLSAAGFQLVASNGLNGLMQGTFTLVEPAATKLTSTGRVEHSSPRGFNASDEATWDFTWNAPSAGPPGEIIFYMTGNAVNENSNIFGDRGLFNTSSTITLPLEWAYFNIEDIDDRINLTWGTYNEYHTSHFDIEISQDGEKFKTMGREEAQGFEIGLSEYEFMMDWGQAPKLYVRIKQVDIDGNFEYSKISFVERKIDEIFIYPTVVSNHLNIELGEYNSYQLVKATGQLMTSNSNKSMLDISDFPAGVYFIIPRDEWGQPGIPKRFLKK